MSLVLFFAAFFGYYFFAVNRLRLSEVFAPFFIVSAMIVVLYWAAYFHGLYVVAWALLLLGFPGWFFCRRLNSSSLGLLLLFSAVVGFLALGVHVLNGDELAQWGPHAKNLFLNNGFLKATDSSAHLSYPPGGDLFYYLFFLTGEFSEAKAYFAQQFLMISAALVVLNGIGWKRSLLGLIGFSVMLAIAGFFGAGFGFNANLCMDGAVGLFFGALLVSYRFSNRQISDILLLTVPVFVLSLLKLKLFPLVLVVTVFIALDQLRYLLMNNAIFSMRELAKRALVVLSLPLSAFIAIASWNHYLRVAKIPLEWGMKINWFTVTERQTEVLSHFIQFLWQRVLPIAAIFFVAIILLLWLTRDREKRRALLMDHLLLFAGFVAYLFGLLLMYLFAFGDYEAVRLASINRYLDIYYLAWSMLIFASLFKVVKNSPLAKKIMWQWISLFICVVVFAWVNIAHYHHLSRVDVKNRSQWQLRQGVRQITNRVKMMTPPNARVFIVWQNDPNYAKNMMAYELIPRYVNPGASGYITAPSKQDIWSAVMKKKDFLNSVASYDYLLVGYANKTFWNLFGSLFPKGVKPFVRYPICLKRGVFHPLRHKGCEMTTEYAYLFKIVRDRNRIIFQPQE